MLQKKVVEEDLKKRPNQRKMVSKVLYANGKYVKAFCEGFLGSEGDLCLRMSGTCEDSEITILDEELRSDVLFGICKAIFVY